MFENMYFVKLFTSKHEKPKTCLLERYKVRILVIIFYTISFVYMYVCKLKNINICIRIVLSWFSLLTVA